MNKFVQIIAIILAVIILVLLGILIFVPSTRGRSATGSVQGISR
jgi:uncharacterized protein YpmB